VRVGYRKMSNFSAISWRKLFTFDETMTTTLTTMMSALY